ncbi:hypothetical protein D3C87_2044020 [compost metagenome]
MAMPAGARGVDAIEHVDAPADGAQDVVGLADTHQVARPVRREFGRDFLDHPKHHLLRFAHGQAAHGIAVKADGA